MPPWLPLAADTEAVGLVLLAADGVVRMGRAGTRRRSVDSTRSVADVAGGAVLGTVSGPALIGRAFEFGAVACAAQLPGAGRALLEASVRHVRVRTQFGRPVGAFQAVKHKLADAAYRAARVALQVHGAIGYTEEHDVSLWLTKIRASSPPGHPGPPPRPHPDVYFRARKPARLTVTLATAITRLTENEHPFMITKGFIRKNVVNPS